MSLNRLYSSDSPRLASRLIIAFLVVLSGLGSASITMAAEPSFLDTDGDGYDDATEISNGWSPYGAGKLENNDADADGLSDGDELKYGTNPLDSDSDNDGYSDGVEVKNGYDPLSNKGAKLKKRVSISIAKQELTYYMGNAAVATHAVSTGRPGYRTPIGTFAILDKKPRAWSTSAKLWMPYWMPFITTKYGLHELPEWPGGKKEGANQLGKPVSGGCVRLGVGAAKELYDWVEVGTEVTISKT